jgi:hypothetical protein
MFDESLIDLITVETNRYAAQKMALKPDPKWYPLPDDGSETRAFLAMNILMGIHILPAYADYWSTDPRLHVKGIASVMTKNRFEHVNKYFRLNDNTKCLPRDDPNHDRLFKIRPVVDACVANFQKYYYPGRDLSVDEAMVAFNGRSGMKQYMPAKPDKWGYKVWQLNDARNAFTCNYQVYTGKDKTRSAATAAEKGLGYRVVMDMAKPYLGKKHHLFFDNWCPWLKIS